MVYAQGVIIETEDQQEKLKYVPKKKLMYITAWMVDKVLGRTANQILNIKQMEYIGL